ncbi:MAG: tetratricopeptide repeat protein, partial [Bacteroidota bacterium]
STELDSLITLTEKGKNDSVKVENYIRISEIYLYTDQEKSLEYATRAQKLSKLTNYKRGQAESYYLLGIINEYASKYEDAKTMFRNAKTIYENLKDTFKIADSEKHIGINFESQGDFNNALTNYMSALKKMEDIQDMTGIASCKNGIAVIYMNTGSYDEALKFYKDNLVVLKKINYDYGIAITYNNMGMSYEEQIESKDTINIYYLDSALTYYTMAGKIHEKINDPSGLGKSHLNIANVYYRCEKYNDALKHYNLSLEIMKQLDDKKYMAKIYMSMGSVYRKNNSLLSAGDYYNKSLLIYEELKDSIDMRDVYFNMANLYEDQKDFEKAYYNFRKFKEIDDSLFTRESSKLIVSLQEQFNKEKREAEIKILNQDKEIQTTKINQQRNLIIIFVIVSIIIFVFLVMLFRLFNQKKKANILLGEQNEEIRSQNDEIAAQRDEITVQKEHIEEIHEELTSSIQYARRIQRAVIPNDTYLTDNMPDNFVLFRPHSVVSGDFYWATRIKNLAIFTAADCTGHGVPGAFMSMLGISFLNEIVHNENVTNAANILDKLRKKVIFALGQKGISGEQKDGMDISFCVLDMDTNILQWAGGNNPLYIISDRFIDIPEAKIEEIEDSTLKLYDLKPDKMPIAIYEKMDDFTNIVVQLEKSDLLYMFSDGFADQFGGEKGKKFMYKPFKRLLLEHSDKPMAEQKTILNQAFEAWIGHIGPNGNPHEQIDDVVVFGVRI